jgi:hypothetical protein
MGEIPIPTVSRTYFYVFASPDEKRETVLDALIFGFGLFSL